MARNVRLKTWNFAEFASVVCVLAVVLQAFAQDAIGSIPHFTDFHFRQEPQSLVARRGDRVLFNCSATQGQQPAQIQWMKDGEFIKNTSRRYMLENGSLIITSISQDKGGESDHGRYQCSATVDRLGTIRSRVASLDVASNSRQFEAVPQNLTLHLNDTAMFECEPHRSPSPDVRWYRDNILLSSGPRTLIYPTGVLELSMINSADFGSYRCEVRDRRSSPFAKLSLNLTALELIQGRSPEFVMKPRSQEVEVGQEVHMHCGANGRDHLYHPPSIIWLKDGATVDFEGSRRLKLIGSGTLHIADVRQEDAGTYTCRANNAEDSIDTDALLTVLVPPYFVKKPANVFAYVNHDIILECEAEGRPPPEITWYKNGERVYPSDYFQLVAGTSLKIFGLMNTDEGIYQCFAANILGNIQASSQLLILQPDLPSPTTPLPHVVGLPAGALYSDLQKLPEAPKDLSAVLVSRRFVTVSWKRPEDEAVAASIAAYAVYWREHGSERERVSNTTQTEFNIQNLKPDTSYEVRVRTYNKYGPSQKEATIIVTTDHEVHVPSPPVNLMAIALSSTSISVTWGPPQDPKGLITHYSLIYYEVGSNGEEEVKVTETNHILQNLSVFREYSVRVVAHNHNGPGMSTAEVVARTFSDVPGTTPQNFTLEVSSATRIIVRWQPPPPELQNGIIIGYKIRYRAHGDRGGETVVTDGNRNTYALTELEKGMEYKVRIAAMTVNGTGPPTGWETATTYLNDLDESQTPPWPARLQAKPRANSIVVQWAPPAPDSKILVRGYVLGYGRGIADVYQVRLDAGSHDYTITNLQPASEYVISIKAFNNLGHGPSRYATVVTSDDIAEEPATPMMPPIGLKAIVLTSSTIVLTWADDSLGKSQKIVDNRYYTVRFSSMPRTRNKYLNATDLVAHIDGLKPNTQYTFAVRVINGRRVSEWSMTVSNTTFEAEPGSEPRDITPVKLEGDPLSVSIHWQPPLRPNGQITGYLIFYTARPELPDWMVEGVLGDKLSTVINKLTADTTYHFQVQARNKKGYSPRSRVVKYKTPPASETAKAVAEESEGMSMNMIIIIVACIAGVLFIGGIAVVTVVLCRRRDSTANRGGTYKSPVKPIKASGKDVPPDLWIHQPTMELKRMDPGRRSESSVSVATSTLNRGSHASTDRLDDLPGGSDVEKKRHSFVGESGYPSSSDERYQPVQPRNIIRPKPITLPVDTAPPTREPVATITALPNGHILNYVDNAVAQGSIGMRPIYPRTQYNTQYTGQAPPRVHAGDIPHTAQSKASHSESEEGDERGPCSDGGDDCGPGYISRIGYGPRSPESPTGYFQAGDSSQLALGRGGRSYSLANAAESGSVTPTPRHIGRVKPQPNLSPYKKPSPPVSSGPVKSRTPMPFASKPDVTQHSKSENDMTKSLSTEELSAEMANLEGLMKDLNAITQQEFEC